MRRDEGLGVDRMCPRREREQRSDHCRQPEAKRRRGRRSLIRLPRVGDA
jgi:hypothetical protein